MDIEDIRQCVAKGQHIYSRHAEIERKADKLTFTQIREALLSGEILEQYPDTGRGESCLVVGFAGETPIHIVCGWLSEKVVSLPFMFPNRLSSLILGHEEEQVMNEETKKVQCPFCGGGYFEKRQIEYLYSYEDKYLLVPNTPVEICMECGMTYYDATVLEEIERRFFAIHQNDEEPDCYVQLPIAVYA